MVYKGSWKSLISIILIILLMLTCYIAGGYMENDSHAVAVGALDSENGKWQAFENDNGASVTVGYAGQYKIRVVGGGNHAVQGGNDSYDITSTGGDLTGIITLKKGDIIQYRTYRGGFMDMWSYNGLTEGGKATMVFVNDIPIIGAGGGGGHGLHSFGSAITGTSTNRIENYYFSSGSGGCEAKHGVPTAGNTISGCLPAPTTGQYSSAGVAGQNYLASGTIDLVEQPNGGMTPTCTISFLKVSQEENPKNFERIANSIALIANEMVNVKQANKDISEAVRDLSIAISNGAIGGGGNDFPERITVIAGKQFDEYIRGSDTTDGGTVEGITVINNDESDGYVRVVGNIKNTGNKEVVIDGIKYVFKAVEEPDSTNVTTVLN